MILPAKALLALSVLTSMEAMAHTRLVGRDANLFGEGMRSRSAETYGSFRPISPRLTHPRDSETYIKTTQSKGPVDVMSLALGGALACFFGLAMIRRRKTASMPDRSPRVRLPEARVVPGSLRNLDNIDSE